MAKAHGTGRSFSAPCTFTTRCCPASIPTGIDFRREFSTEGLLVDPHSKSTVATAVFTHVSDRDFSLDKSCRDFASTPRLGRRRRKSRCRPAGWFAKVAARMAQRLSLTHTGIQRRARVHVHRSRPTSACTPRVAHHASLHRPPRGECIGGRSRLTLAGPSKRMIKLSDPSQSFFVFYSQPTLLWSIVSSHCIVTQYLPAHQEF